MFKLFNSKFQIFRDSPFRHWVWPVRSNELYKFAPMATLMFIILLNQNLVRNLKDSVVVTIIGAESISFIKLWMEMPAGILFVLLYARMCNVMSTEQAFRYIVSGFLAFFAFFAYVLFPNMSFFHPSEELVQSALIAMPNLKWFIVLWSKWSIALFYVMGELWPVIIFSLLFWQLANKTTKTDEASRFYPFFSFFGQTNLLFSAVVILYFTSGDHIFVNLFPTITDKSELLIKSQMLLVMILGVCILLLHKHIEKRVINDKRTKLPTTHRSSSLKLSLRESINLIFHSKYLGLVSLLVISYGVVVIIIEGVWMYKVSQLYTDANSFSAYQAKVYFGTGIFTLFCSFLGSTLLRYVGWFWGAVITPVMFAFVGGGFFIAVIMQDQLEYILSFFPYLSPLSLIVVLGGLQNVLGKGTKYSLFDATKEMAYIPLDDELKTKGKAAVDVVGMKIGKSIGSITQFATFTLVPTATYDDITGFLTVIFFIVSAIWIWAVFKLAKQYNSLTVKT